MVRNGDPCSQKQYLPWIPCFLNRVSILKIFKSTHQRHHVNIVAMIMIVVIIPPHSIPPLKLRFDLFFFLLLADGFTAGPARAPGMDNVL